MPSIQDQSIGNAPLRSTADEEDFRDTEIFDAAGKKLSLALHEDDFIVETSRAYDIQSDDQGGFWVPCAIRVTGDEL